MSQSDVLARAKQGDSRAISTLLGHYVQTEGVTVRVTQRDNCLYILLEAPQLPDLQTMVSVMERQIVKLQLATISTLMIFGRKSGDKKAIWQRVIELDTLSGDAPIPGELSLPDTATDTAADSSDNPVPGELSLPDTAATTESLGSESLPAPEELQPSTSEIDSSLDPLPSTDPPRRWLQQLASEDDSSLANLAMELLSTRSTPIAANTPEEPDDDDSFASGCVAIPQLDLPDLEATPETTLASLSGMPLEPEPDSTMEILAASLLEFENNATQSDDIATENAILATSEESLLESITRLESDDITASEESLLESIIRLESDDISTGDAALTTSGELLLESTLDTDVNDTDVSPDLVAPTESLLESEVAPEIEPVVHLSQDLEPMTTSDRISVPDPWDADGQSSVASQMAAVANVSQSDSTSASAPDEAATDTSKVKNPSLREVAEALRGVTTVDTQSLLQRPEAIVLLAWLSMLVVWQLYLALATDEEIPGDQPLSNRKLAKRLGVHPRTLSRRRHRSDFSGWSQDLDPQGIAWTYEESGGYAPVLPPSQ